MIFMILINTDMGVSLFIDQITQPRERLMLLMRRRKRKRKRRNRKWMKEKRTRIIKGGDTT